MEVVSAMMQKMIGSQGCCLKQMVKRGKNQSEQVGKWRRNNVLSEVIANAKHKIYSQVYLKISNISKHE